MRAIYSTVGEPFVPDLKDGDKAIFHVLTLGHVVDYKDPFTWIEVALQLKRRNAELDIRFTWVGDGPLLKECQALVSAHRADSFVRFVGQSDAIEAYYSECDVYLQPSRIESLGLSVLDAMRYGIPCVVADAGGLPEVVVDGETGWVVEVGNVKEFADRLESLLKEGSLRTDFGRKGQARYIANFSCQRWAQSIWDQHLACLKH